MNYIQFNNNLNVIDISFVKRIKYKSYIFLIKYELRIILQI